MDRLDAGTGTRAVQDGLDATALLARIESLEKRQEHGEDLARRALAEEVGRAVQSIGVVVDYLASRGLIDKADLQAHIERNFHITRLGNEDGPYRGVIDVYGWLMWAEDTREWRGWAPRPGLRPADEKGSASVCIVRSPGLDFEAEARRDGHLEGQIAEG